MTRSKGGIPKRKIEMNKSTTISKLASALAKAQAEMPAVKFDGVNPFLKNKYATLGAVIETSRPILAKYELALMQSPVSEGEKIGVTTLLIHSSGEFIEDTIYLPASDSKGLSVAQSAGVVISYLRRYSLQAFLNMYADEDTDGHKPEQKAEKQEPITLEQAKAFKTSDGKLYGDLLRADLERIKDNAAAPEDKKRAARTILAELIKECK
jgi:hypothetical protein